jgi:hypothetical protein
MQKRVARDEFHDFAMMLLADFPQPTITGEYFIATRRRAFVL